MHVIHAAHSSGFTLRFQSLCLSLFLFVFASLALSFSHSLYFLSLSPCSGCTPASYISTDVQFISYVTSSTYVYIYAVVRKLEYRPFTCRQADKPRPALKRLNAPIVAFSSETGTRCTAKRISQVHFVEKALVRNRR